MKRTFLVMACILIATLVFAEENRYAVPIGDSPATGPANAPVTMIEFLDFQ